MIKPSSVLVVMTTGDGPEVEEDDPHPSCRNNSGSSTRFHDFDLFDEASARFSYEERWSQ